MSPSLISQARNFLAQQSPNLSDKISGFWTGICGGNSSCKTIPSEVNEELTFDDTPEASEASESFIGLCSMAKEMIDDFPFIYSCQCEQDFGYENCTEVQQDETTIDAGT